MNIGKAVEALRSGKAIARSGWNGKNMYLYKANQELPGSSIHSMAQLITFMDFRVGMSLSLQKIVKA